MLLSIGGGVALTAFAGARRTDTAIPRLVAYSRPDDGGFITRNILSPPVPPGRAAYSLALTPVEQRIVDLPQVEAYFRSAFLFLATDPSGSLDLNPLASADASLYRTVDRPLLLAGRLPDPAQPFDAAINEIAATRRHLRVGSTVQLYAYSVAQFEKGQLASDTAVRQIPAGPAFHVRVTAIVRLPTDVSAIGPLVQKQDVSYEGQQSLLLTPAFLPRLAAGLGIPVRQIQFLNFVGVRLRYGSADWDAFAAAAAAIGAGRVTAVGGEVEGVRTAAASAQRSVHLEVMALTLFGAFAALVTLVLVGQAIARQAQNNRDDYATLRALGAARPQLIGIVLLGASLTALVGACGAFMVAALASPLMPIGLARQAETHTGYDVNLAILLPACLGLVAVLTASLCPTAWRVTAVRKAGARPVGAPRGVDTWRPALLSPPAAIGLRQALTRRRGAMLSSTAMVSGVLAVASFAAAITFGTSLEHFVGTPRQQGWNWDVLVGNPHDQTDREAQAGALLARNPLVASYSAIAILAGSEPGSTEIDGKSVDTMLAIDPMKGAVYPPLIEGRAPRSGEEIVLGSHTLRRLHKEVGASVQVRLPVGVRTLQIVGRMVSPSAGDVFSNRLGDGAWVYGPFIRRIVSQSTADPGGAPPVVFSLFAVRYAPGASPVAGYDSLRSDFGRTVLRSLPSEDGINLQSVARVPLWLAALIAVIGVLSFANTLVSSIRQRRRDLAMLKVVGFVRRQVLATVVCQSVSLAVIVLVFGVPLGIAVGRWTWTVVAADLESVSPAVVPASSVALVVPVAIGLALIVAAIPGWWAARMKPAAVMRSE
jgi:ABC-type lipoprotein release transport system permease subunit